MENGSVSILCPGKCVLGSVGCTFLNVLLLQSIRQYEHSLRLTSAHLTRVLTRHLRTKQARRLELLQCGGSDVHPTADRKASKLHVPVEYTSLNISRSLLPAIVQLKWQMAKDKLAQSVRSSAPRNFRTWIMEGHGRVLMGLENERVRLAVCPDVKKIVGFWEDVARKA